MPDVGQMTLEDAKVKFNKRAQNYLLAVDKIGRPDEPELFHYCSLQSAFNILKSGKIWASEVYHLNDATEVAHGAGVMAELASRTEIHPDVRAQFCDPDEFMKTASQWTMFVFCLSRKHDLLSQWRAYGKSGGGVCIGFDRAQLQSIRPKQGPVPTPFPIIYKRRKQVQLLERLIDIAAELRQSLAPGSDEKEYWRNAMALITQGSFRFKDRAFAEEQEWRLLWLPAAEIQFRPMERTLIPYIEAEFCKSVVTKVVQGPLFNPAVGESSLRRFLDGEGYRHVSIQRSHIPLRTL